MTRFVDLSIPITNDVISDPDVMRPKITYMTHEDTWQQIAMFFPGLQKADLPDGEGWAVEMLELSTHNGTHMDAPWHYHSTTGEGALPAPSIDEAPLDRFFRPGVKLDFSHLPSGHVVNAAEVEAELDRIGYELKPLDIVLVQSGAVYGTENFIDQGVGLGAEATLWLTGRGVEVVGTDAWSWDAPFSHTARRWAENRDPAIIWEGHKAGRIRPLLPDREAHQSRKPAESRLHRELLPGEDRTRQRRLDQGGGTGRRLEQPRAVRHRLIRREQHDLASLVGKAQRQHFGHRRTDLPRRKVDDRRDLPPGKLLKRVIRGNLRAALLLADRRAEIDAQPVARLARFGKRFGSDDRTDANVCLQERLEIDRFGNRRVGRMVEVHYSSSRITSSTIRLSPCAALIFATLPCFSARRMFSIFIASTVASG